RVELRGARPKLGILEALDRPVVERAVRDARLVARCDREPVVLRRDENLAAAVVEHRMVRAAVAEGQLVRLLLRREREQLVAETDAEHRRAAEQLAKHVRLLLERGRIAGPR